MKLFTLLIITFFIITGIAQAQPARIPQSDIYWEINVTDGDSALHITGSGYIPSHDQWKPYCSSIKHITIDEGITGIAPYTFSRYTALLSVKLPESLQEISSALFQNDSLLTRINTPAKVQKIGGYAFQRTRLKDTIIFPETLRVLEGSAFANTDITHTIIPATIDTLMPSLFSQTQLTTIILPSTLKYICRYAFYNTPLTHITCMALDPPAIQDENAFFNICRSSCTITVPSSALDTYKSTPIWQDFFIEAGGLSANIYADKAKGYVKGLSNRFYSSGERINAIAVADSNYTFTGWKSNNRLISANSILSFTITQDTVIEACFESNTAIYNTSNTRNEVSIYPNPAGSYLHIQACDEIKRISLYDISGKMILYADNTKRINIEHLSAGIYIVKIECNKLCHIKKVIKL